jgi:hypothetical protein
LYSVFCFSSYLYYAKDRIPASKTRESAENAVSTGNLAEGLPKAQGLAD